MTSLRRGAQVEITASLAVVMVTATGLLAAFFLASHVAETERLQPLLGRALAHEARRISVVRSPALSGTSWFVVSPLGHARRVLAPNQPPNDEVLDDAARALALKARSEGRPLLQAGAPWEAVRFAAPIRGINGDEIAVAVIKPAVSRAVVVLLLLADCVAFTVLGVYLLRRRVVDPLRRLAAGARSIREGGLGARVAVEGVLEVGDVGRALNEMTEALESRTGALEKAVTELRTVNQRLSSARDGLDRAERMAAVGHLAAGVAHEVGNPMGAVLAFLDLAQRDGSLSETARAYLVRASGQGERVREILRQLLDFSRPPRPASAPMDLAASAEQALGLARAQARYEEVEFELVAAKALQPVLADESLVAQILLNLVLNAADAALASPAKRVRLRVAAAPLRLRSTDREPTSAVRVRRETDAVECRVEDSGSGVAEEDRERIFDPFFTTKPPGEGTGLGLANALRLTEELGGILELGQSDLGGAAFSLRLRLAGELAGQGVRVNRGSRTP